MSEQPPKQAPLHVGIIMDGNGRWAKARALPRLAGHRAGAETIRRILEACPGLGVHWLTLYAFSTENWRRPDDEVSGLMSLLDQFLRERRKDLDKQRIRLNAIGGLERIPEPARTRLFETMAATRHHDRGVLTLALNYGARSEIVTATRRLAEEVAAGRLRPDEITEERLSGALSTAGMPDPDLIIRTSGEMRLSNFLLWQASYAEFWCTPTLWPDFSCDEFRRAVEDLARRGRRFGGLANV